MRVSQRFATGWWEQKISSHLTASLLNDQICGSMLLIIVNFTPNFIFYGVKKIQKQQKTNAKSSK
jgi:hypothetical protein